MFVDSIESPIDLSQHSIDLVAGFTGRLVCEHLARDYQVTTYWQPHAIEKVGE